VTCAARIARAAALAAVLALVAAGCGSGSGSKRGADDASNAAVAPLLDRVPRGASTVSALDLATAKRQLGVAADLDPARYRERLASGTPEERLDEAALKVLDYLFFTSPFTKAIDHAKVSAAVHANLLAEGYLTILRTSQPQADIARRLVAAGMKREEGGFVIDGPELPFGLAAAALGADGIVVFAKTIAVATSAARRRAPDPGVAQTRQLLDATHGPLRTVQMASQFPDAEVACLRGIAGSQTFTSGAENEDVALRLTGEPRASEVTLGEGAQRRDPLTSPYRVTGISRSGQLLTLKIRVTPNPRHHANGVTVAGDTLPDYLVYRCPGAAAEQARRKRERDRKIEPATPEADRTGSRLETVISDRLAVSASAPTAVRVRCPVPTLPRGTRKLHCTGTRPDGAKRYHYTLSIAFNQDGTIKYIDTSSPDDDTGTIVSEPEPTKPPPPPEPDADHGRNRGT
jgi:hypothetical protein